MPGPARSPIDADAASVGRSLPELCVNTTDSCRQGECEDFPAAGSQVRARLFAMPQSVDRVECRAPSRRA